MINTIFSLRFPFSFLWILCLHTISYSSVSAQTRCTALMSANTSLFSLHDIALSSDPRKALSDYFEAKFQGNYDAFVEQFYEGGYAEVEGRVLSVNYGSEFLNKVRAINPSWEKLVVNPGVVQNQTRFFKFVIKNKLQSLSAEKVYQIYAKHLGRVVVYRAIVLDKQIRPESLQEEPLLSLFLKKQKQFDDYEFRTPNIYKELTSHLRNSSATFSMSVTYIREVALAVANSFLARDPKTKRVILFELSIPKIDLISADSKSIFDTVQYKGKKIYIVNGSNVEGEFLLDRKVESIIFGGILPEEILSVKVVKSNYAFFVD